MIATMAPNPGVSLKLPNERLEGTEGAPEAQIVPQFMEFQAHCYFPSE